MKKHSFLSTANQSSPVIRILFGLVILLYVMTVLLLGPAKEIFELQGHLLLIFSIPKRKLNARIYALVHIIVLLASSLIILLLFRKTMRPSPDLSAAVDAGFFLLEQFLALREMNEEL